MNGESQFDRKIQHSHVSNTHCWVFQKRYRMTLCQIKT